MISNKFSYVCVSNVNKQKVLSVDSCEEFYRADLGTPVLHYIFLFFLEFLREQKL